MDHIGEVDERRLYARFAFSSMFVYCTERLHLSEAAAYRRITVARCSRECPAILSALRDGRVHLSGLATLAPLLTPANCSDLFARATHRTKRQIEELVATLAPQPDARSGIRRLLERHRLEFHHRHPYGTGGDHRPDNIRLMCPAHNRYLAERDYGSAAIRSRAASQRPVPLADPHT